MKCGLKIGIYKILIVVWYFYEKFTGSKSASLGDKSDSDMSL